MNQTIDMNVPVRRGFSAEYRADENKISGLPAVYGQQTNIGGMFIEIIERGAFDGCDLTDVPLFVEHDTHQIPIARSRRNNGNSTMEIRITEQGLEIDANPDVENNFTARALYHSIQRGDMSGMSFLFKVAEQRWDDMDTELPKRHILKIAKVFEVSAVNFPAYAGTSINARSDGSLDSDRKALEKAKTEHAAALDSVRRSREIELLKIKSL